MNERLLAGSGVPAPVRAILQRACQNCHSANTVWPWYAQIPPISWRIHGDVEKGRAVLDFSKWDDYSAEERQGLRATIGAAVRSNLMPPPEYLWVHRDARLSKAELEAVQAWALGEVENKPSTVSGAQPERSRKPGTDSLRSKALD